MDEGMTEEFEQQKTELTDIQDENSVADDTASAPQSPSQDITTESVIEAILFASQYR
jgi:hypothetical protein